MGNLCGTPLRIDGFSHEVVTVCCDLQHYDAHTDLCFQYYSPMCDVQESN